MKNYRDALLDRMIRLYGFEHPVVINFAQMCGQYTEGAWARHWDECLRVLVEAHEEDPQIDDEEDE